MAFTSATQGSIADINMTPMIDILLVLIVIFMVITPLTPTGLEARIAQPAAENAQPVQAGPAVVSVDQTGAIFLNREAVTLTALEARLRELFQSAARPVVFVRGHKDLEFRQIAQVIDAAKGAGIANVALATTDLP
jgi:biopolymer transport protein ExbD